MNILDAIVTKILTKPAKVKIEDREYWIINAEYNCYGRTSERVFVRISKQEAEDIRVGYKFQT